MISVTKARVKVDIKDMEVGEKYSVTPSNEFSYLCVLDQHDDKVMLNTVTNKVSCHVRGYKKPEPLNDFMTNGMFYVAESKHSKECFLCVFSYSKHLYIVSKSNGKLHMKDLSDFNIYDAHLSSGFTAQ